MTAGSLQGATLILRDQANVIGSGIGMNLGVGWNSGITTTSTRMEGTAGTLPVMRYWRHTTARALAAYWLTNTVDGDASTGKLYTRLANNGNVLYERDGPF